MNFSLLYLYKWPRFGKGTVERNPVVSKTVWIFILFGREKDFFFLLFYFCSLLEKVPHWVPSSSAFWYFKYISLPMGMGKAFPPMRGHSLGSPEEQCGAWGWHCVCPSPLLPSRTQGPSTRFSISGSFSKSVKQKKNLKPDCFTSQIKYSKGLHLLTFTTEHEKEEHKKKKKDGDKEILERVIFSFHYCRHHWPNCFLIFNFDSWHTMLCTT